MNKTRISKILAILSCIFLTLALYIIATTLPASGYELSIYDVYPPYFWLFLIGSTACGICILVHQAFNEQKSRWWLVGLLVIIFSNLIILCLPIFRGYALYGRGDTPSHLGYMKDILITGHIGKSNFYPILHLLGVNILNITRLSLGTTVNLISAFFSILYMVNIYLLATSIANHRGQILLIAAFASPLIFSFFHMWISPAILSIYIIPLLLYFYHRREKFLSNQPSNSIVLVLLILLITFFHPVTILYCMVMFFTFGFSSLLSRLVLNYRKSNYSFSLYHFKGCVIISLISFVAFWSWYFSYSAIQGSLKETFNWLFYEGSVSRLSDVYLELVNQYGLTLFQRVEILFKRLGAIGLYFLVSLVFVVYLWKQIISKKTKISEVNFTYSVQLIVAFFISLALFWGYSPERNFVRISRFWLAISPVLNGLVIYELVNRNVQPKVHKKTFSSSAKISISFVVLVIFSSNIISIFNVYPSPMVMSANPQVTEMEVSGMRWFFEDCQNSEAILAVGVPQFPRRIADLIYGVEEVRKHSANLNVELIPSHFGYDQNKLVIESFDFTEKYMIITELDKIIPMIYPKNVRAKIPQYTKDDFSKLISDPTIMQIYVNSEFEVWKILRK